MSSILEPTSICKKEVVSIFQITGHMFKVVHFFHSERGQIEMGEIVLNFLDCAADISKSFVTTEQAVFRMC